MCQALASTSTPLVFVDRRIALLGHLRDVYRSADAGATWRRAHRFAGDVLDLSPAGCATVFALRKAGTGSVVERSDDRGQTWASVARTPGLFAIAFVTPSVGYGIDGQRSTGYADGNGGAVWKTLDGGRTWRALRESGEVTSVAATPAGVLVATTPERAFRSTDGGERWTPVRSDPDGGLGGSVTFAGDAHVWLHFSSDGAAGTQAYRYHESRDSGRTWRLVAQGLGSDPETAQTSFANYSGPLAGRGGHIVVTGSRPAAGEAVTFTSTDQGRSWLEAVVRQQTSWAADRVAVADGRHAVIAGLEGERLRVYRTTDAGRSWREAMLP